MVEEVDLSYGRTFSRGFPHDFFTWLRREAPVWWHEPTEHTPGGEGFWVVSRYDDVVRIFREATTFSSELGGTQIYDGKGQGYQLNQTDDPKHRRLRGLVNTGFTPRMIGRLEDDLRARARAILDAVPDGEEFDFVPAVARELPLQAICTVLGVPLDDRAELGEVVDLAIGSETGAVMGIDELRRLGSLRRRAGRGEAQPSRRRHPVGHRPRPARRRHPPARQPGAPGLLQPALPGGVRDDPERRSPAGSSRSSRTPTSRSGSGTTRAS